MDIYQLTVALEDAFEVEKLAGRRFEQEPVPERRRAYEDARRATNLAREALDSYVAVIQLSTSKKGV